MHWQEKEWRPPRRGEVVKDEAGIRGIVREVEGILGRKKIWVDDENGVEIRSGEPAELFTVVPIQEARDFYLQTYRNKGFYQGAFCSPKTSDIPLQIVSINHVLWSTDKVVLRDLRKYEFTTIEVDRVEVLTPLEIEMISPSVIFGEAESSLDWKIKIEVERNSVKGEFNVGSPTSFKRKEDAHEEIERILCRLKARRVASVLNGDWTSESGWFVVPKYHPVKGYQIRLEKCTEIFGAPCYFKTGRIAALGSTYLTPREWYLASSVSRDLPF